MRHVPGGAFQLVRLSVGRPHAVTRSHHRLRAQRAVDGDDAHCEDAAAADPDLALVGVGLDVDLGDADERLRLGMRGNHHHADAEEPTDDGHERSFPRMRPETFFHGNLLRSF